MGTAISGWERETLSAFIKINRLPTTVGYNIAYFLVGAALASYYWKPNRLGLVGCYVCAIFLVKMQASVADALHDQQADATNPMKSSVAHAVTVLGRNVSWTLLMFELVGALALFGYVAVRTGDLLYLWVGVVFAVLGFCYSYPPRLKERGALNHLVTTGTDVAFVVLAFTYLLTDTLPTRAIIVGSVLFLYSFAYHLLHQAADAHYDRESGIETFATRFGPDRTVVAAGLLTAGAAGVAIALSYAAAAIALLVVTGFYVWLYTDIWAQPLQEQTTVLSKRFNIARIATALNLTLAVSILRSLGTAWRSVPL